MKKLIHEAHRRSLWQVLGIYLAGSWIALQVVAQLADSVGFPDWVEPFALVLLIIGLPIVMATAFVQEGVAPTTAGAGGSSEEDATAVTDSDEFVEAPAPASTSSSGSRKLFTWRNALGGGALAFLFLVAVTIAWIIMRQAGIGPAGSLVARGVLDDRSPVIVSEFESSDETLGRAATEAFRVDLSQSPVVRVMEPAFVTEALVRMERPRDTPITSDLASEIAVREGVPAIVTGEINPIGSGYVLTARLLAADGEAVLASERETAADVDEIIPAIDELSKHLREQIGESYTSLRADPPLERVTTGSINALRLYSDAIEAIETNGDVDRGIALLEEAIEADSSFAMAHRKLAVELKNRLEDQSRQDEALRQAYRFRDRLTERERYLTMAAYYEAVTGETEKAITAYEQLLERDPNDNWALNNVAILYGDLGDEERQVEMMTRSLAIDSARTLAYTNLASALMQTGQYDEAEAILDRAVAYLGVSPDILRFEAFLAELRGDYEAADSILSVIESEYQGSLFWRSFAANHRASLDGTQGRVEAALAHARRSAEIARERDLPGEMLEAELSAAEYEAFTLRDQGRAAARLDRALSNLPLESLPFADRPYLRISRLQSRIDRPDEAAATLERFESQADSAQLRRASIGLGFTRGLLAEAEGDFDQAIRFTRAAIAESNQALGEMVLARMYEGAGQSDSAVVAYERYVNGNEPIRIYWDRLFLPHSLERLGQLYDEAGDTENAALYYARFVELWEEADPVLQPRVNAARERLEQIVAERG
jgi:tetratricopeptide (TPR) repeat protein